jgi:hypothetical protein
MRKMMKEEGPPPVTVDKAICGLEQYSLTKKKKKKKKRKVCGRIIASGRK